MESLFSICDVQLFLFLSLVAMASAYKSAMRSGDPSDSDDSSSVSSEESSNSLLGEASEEVGKTAAQKKQHDVTQIPVEIRNRVLMLTSRGVSYR